MPAQTLYLCYFGLREPLVQTQVLPYLRQLVKAGLRVHLLTFEPQQLNHREINEWRERLRSEGIEWRWLTYHKWPSLLATIYDVLIGAWVAGRWSKRAGVDVLHARSHVAAMMGALARWIGGGRLIFDIRGFMAEEYVDAGVWKQGSLPYRITKAAERKLLNSADGFVVLTEKARQILFGSEPLAKPVAVIPCCVDSQRFALAVNENREALRENLGLTGRRVLVYTGALGGWYLTDELVNFLAQAHREDAATFALILTQSPANKIIELLRAAGLAEGDFMVRSVAPEEVPLYLRAADVAVSFIKPCYSKLSSSPTKIAEYLVSGLPVISNAGIGDVDEVIQQDRVGVLVHEFNEMAYAKALQEISQLCTDSELAKRCRRSAQLRFDLVNVGGARYVRLYRQVLAADVAALESVQPAPLKSDE